MSPQLLQDERPILVARMHWSVLIPRTIWSAVLLVVGFTIVVLIPQSIAGHRVEGLRQLLGALVVLVVVVYAGLHYLRWRFTTYVLTNHRIILSKGVLSKVSESIGLDRVQNMTIRQGVFIRMIGCGDVEIESAGRDGVEVLRRIPDPQRFENTLISATEALRRGASAPTASAL